MRNRVLTVFLPLIIALSLIAGILIGKHYRYTTADSKFIIYPRLDKLSAMLNYVEREYVDPVSRFDLEEKAIPKILEELDPHSQYIPASDLQSASEPIEGNFSGIGIQFNMLNDTLIVISTVANGPSEKIGVLSGDRIIIVDGDTVAGVNLPSDSIVKRLRGPRGTRVAIHVQRRQVNELLVFEIIRDNIPLYSVDVAYMINGKTGYMKINNFSKTTFEEFLHAFRGLKSQGLKNLVIDLRNNGGGIMDAAINIADQFLAGNEMIVYTQGNARTRNEYRSNPGGVATTVNLAILIDEGSASASEILAGAIQDNDRGTIVGRRSFGKGLVQDERRFADGSAVRLTIARYYTPSGRSIQKPYDKGLEDYYNDLNYRYLHGEYLTADSVHLNDTLTYTTPGGKLVYGGGGIMPDIFVPADTAGITPFLIKVRNRGLIHRFALEYTDKYRQELKKLPTHEAFVKHLDRKKVFNQFVTYSAKEGITAGKGELAASGEFMKVQLYAGIARNVIDNQGYYPIIMQVDNTLKRALKLFEK